MDFTKYNSKLVELDRDEKYLYTAVLYNGVILFENEKKNELTDDEKKMITPYNQNSPVYKISKIINPEYAENAKKIGEEANMIRDIFKPLCN